MKHLKIIMLFSLLTFFALANIPANKNQDYENYHQQVLKAEELITYENYSDALLTYEELFNDYNFIFLKEYQIATQLALHLNDKEKARQYLKKGIAVGWEMKSIKRNKYLSKLRDDKEWKSIKKEYGTLRTQYKSKLNQPLRKQVKKMFFKDQWKAIGALFKISSKSQDRYAEKKFAPHSEKQIAGFIDILEKFGYPGEELIGNDFWMSTILSHHNSISQEYAEQDTLYPSVKPKLIKAVKDGQMSPFEYALIDEWYRAVKTNRSEAGYGFLNPPAPSELLETNELRQMAFLRTIELRNKLVDIQNKTGMNFYLPGNPWADGKILVKE